MDAWGFSLSCLEAGNQLMLIVVIEVKGSSPGKKGFKMIVSSDGQLYGSIGGGVMEYNMVELARKALQENNQAVFLKKQVHSPGAGTDFSGLICAGEQTHAFVPIGISQKKYLKAIIQSQEEGKKCILHLSDEGFSVKTAEESSKMERMSVLQNDELSWPYSEEISPPDTLYIFGGGHISIPLSQVCRIIGFKVVVLDDRPDLNTMQNNTFSHKNVLIKYQDSASYIVHPSTAYVCIMTVSHASDQQILEQMIGVRPAYLGMIGSKKKVEKIFSNLKQKGIPESDLQIIDAPMGIPINSETPEEIAVSISARIIMDRNKERN